MLIENLKCLNFERKHFLLVHKKYIFIALHYNYYSHKEFLKILNT